MALTLQSQDASEPFSDTDYELLGNPTYRVVSGCAVTYDASNLTVDVAAGVIKHNGSFVTVSEQLNAVTIVVDGSNPRWSYLTLNGSGAVVLTSGTAAAVPVKPEAPEGVFLAMLRVVNGDTTANGIAVKLDKRILSDVTGVSPQATAIGDSQTLGTGDQAAREDHVHGSAAPGTPDALAIPQTGATGSATAPARADHVHGIGTPAAPTTHSIPTTAAAGSSGDFARRDHAHGQTAPATPNVIQIGDSAAVGVGTDAAREDHEHGLVAPSTPTTQAFGDSAATGSGTDPAREDHVHGMPAAPATGATMLYKAASEEFYNVTTIQDDDDLTFTMVANKNYLISGVLLLFGDTASDFKMEISVPGSSTWDGLWDGIGTGVTTVSTGGTFPENSSVLIGLILDFRVGVAFRGIAKADSSGGTFVLKWASNTSGGSARVDIGSNMSYQLLN